MKRLAILYFLVLLLSCTVSPKLYDRLDPTQKSQRYDAIRGYRLPKPPTLSLAGSPPHLPQEDNGQCSLEQRRRLLGAAVQLSALPPEFQLQRESCHMFLGYHGTCGARAAASIELGIRPQPPRDSNHRSQLGEGFYLTQAYEDAEGWGRRACELGGTGTTDVPAVCAIYIDGAAWMYSQKLFVPRRANTGPYSQVEDLWWNGSKIESWKQHHRVNGQDTILFSFIDFDHEELPPAAREALRQWQMLIPNGSLMEKIVAKCSTSPLNPPENDCDALIDGEWEVQGRRRQHRRLTRDSLVHIER
ncbi:hypothetical protein BKA69DRAFT_1164864 [Paraphysoderma sedebokerense]|nr:hypothetical protein BKA69DRAFT_1164864 [Paraphysoderma sedebokerense]